MTRVIRERKTNIWTNKGLKQSETKVRADHRAPVWKSKKKGHNNQKARKDKGITKTRSI
ncbi:hypothetical protein HYE41_03735 [Mycoplasmopsis bovis]|nr:hypothetical protein [Mycoplasmopsis bovis]QQH20747.1 hypothetical protein HYE41_03735 [Mycoplasmopsis bovis]